MLELAGSYAIAVICKDEPHRVVLARQGSPLVVGIGNGEMFAASDAMAVAGITDRILYLAEGDVCEITPDAVDVFARNGSEFMSVERPVRTVQAYSHAVDLGPYRHYMQKRFSSSLVPSAIRSKALPALRLNSLDQRPRRFSLV